MARIPFVRHRTVSRIANRYRVCRLPVEKVRWQAVWLLAQTDAIRTPAQVGDLIGLSYVTVRGRPLPLERRRPGRVGRRPSE